MREIKFRAWIKREKKMYPVIGTIKDMIILEPTEDVVTAISIEQTELMQYTGLKDSKGQEIYEGDILKAVRNEYGVKIDEVKEVKYDQYMQLMPLHDIVGYDAELWMDESTYEVIGNIYEHRHMLPEESKHEHNCKTI